ncbi:MAG: hypothetical protein ACRECF_08995 [Methyloceanibacter sp.]
MPQSPLQRLEDMHNGLQLAMTALIKDRDYDETERLLRMLDDLMVDFIRDAKARRQSG